MRAFPSLTLLAGTAALASVLGTAQAATIGYWRFEQGAFLSDSSGNGLTLTNNSSTVITQTARPISGPASSFPATIPQNSLSNGHIASFGPGRTADSGTTSDTLSVADPATFIDLTIEAFFHQTFRSTTAQYIAGHWASTGNQRSWALGINGTNAITGVAANNLFFILSSDGSSSTLVDSGISILEDKDYYVAARFDGQNPTSSASIASFYVKNLTDNTAVQTASFNLSFGTLHNTDGAFTIGGQALTTQNRDFIGYIDEVRLSSSVVPDSQLLIVPEPGALALLGMGGALFLRRRRA
jgi:hypothetical protein